jgi:hypothetical protein
VIRSIEVVDAGISTALADNYLSSLLMERQLCGCNYTRFQNVRNLVKNGLS